MDDTQVAKTTSTSSADNASGQDEIDGATAIHISSNKDVEENIDNSPNTPEDGQSIDVGTNSTRSSEISEKTAMLMRKKVGSRSKVELEKPTKRQSAEISNLMSQLMDKRTVFTEEMHLTKDDPRYGTPLEGTKTAARGRQAHAHISKEIIELCEIIWTHGQIRGNTDETTVILFGDLFQLYTRISSKVVGLLLRARKYNLIHFEGETLFQGQDDLTPIYLIRSLKEIRQVFKSGSDPKNFEWGQLLSA